MNWANVFSQNMNLRSLCLYIFELISFKDTCSLKCSVNKLLVHIMFKTTLPIPKSILNNSELYRSGICHRIYDQSSSDIV